MGSNIISDSDLFRRILSPKKGEERLEAKKNRPRGEPLLTRVFFGKR
jgi:hypothetical protein